MNPFSKKFSAYLLTASAMFVINQNLLGQLKGDVVFTMGFGVPKGSIFSLRYFPINRLGIEVHGGAIPHIANYGFGVLVHLAESRPNAFLTVDLTKIHGGRPYFFEDSLRIDTTFVTGASTWGINFGLGREFKWGNSVAYFLFGPSYFLERREDTFNPISGRSSREVPFTPWFGFLDGGVVYSKRK